MVNTIQLSKLMSFVLRHKPESVGITLTSSGWVELSELAQALNVSSEEILAVAGQDSKQRFTISGTLIRAAQGHSFPVDLEFKPASPPEFLWHGTVLPVLSVIEKTGLLPMSREYVHLSAQKETATTVAARRKGEIVLLRIETIPFLAAGHQLFQAENGVWLSAHVPVGFFTKQ